LHRDEEGVVVVPASVELMIEPQQRSGPEQVL